MTGLNQYFGWYRWVADFKPLLEPYLYELRDQYPRKVDRDDRVGRRGPRGAGRRRARPEGQLRASRRCTRSGPST